MSEELIEAIRGISRMTHLRHCIELIGVTMEPMHQDAYEEDLKTMRFQKAVNDLVPHVKDKRTFFDGFIREHYPEVYDNLPEEFMALIHTGLVCYKQFNGVSNSVHDKFEDAAYQEAIRRAEG